MKLNPRFLTAYLCDLVKIAGFGLVISGLAMFSPPLAVIVTGITLVMIGATSKRGR